MKLSCFFLGHFEVIFLLQNYRDHVLDYPNILLLALHLGLEGGQQI